MISERSQTVTLKKVRRYYFSWIESMWVLVCVVVCVSGLLWNTFSAAEFPVQERRAPADDSDGGKLVTHFWSVWGGNRASAPSLDSHAYQIIISVLTATDWSDIKRSRRNFSV